MSLQGKVAVVTGGAQGIGKAIAKMFMEKKCTVVIVDSDWEAGEETAGELAPLGKARLIPADVARENEVREMIREVIGHFGRLDVLVNNAGIFRGAALEVFSLDEWNRVIGVNLTGPFLCVKHAAPHLKTRAGAIVNIASTRAFMSEPDTEAYAASKGGIVALTHALAVSLGPAVRVNCVSPGWIAVDAWQKKSRRGDPDLTTADHGQHPAGRVGKPEDVASLVTWLASPEASFVTGANFIVDGGMTRKMIYV